MNTVKGWDAFSAFKSPTISRFRGKIVSHDVGGANSQKPYLKNGTVEIFLMVGMDSAYSNYPTSIVHLTTIYPLV
jgi:hypothetical protein